MGTSCWNGRLCQSPDWIFYSRKGFRNKSSDSTACPWECQGRQKIWWFCKAYYGEERTSPKPTFANIKIPQKAIGPQYFEAKGRFTSKSDQNLFGKKFRSHVVETEHSQKRPLEVFSGGSHSAPPPAKKLFWTGPSPNHNKPFGWGRFYYGKNPNNWDRHSAQYGGKQNNKWNNRLSGKQNSGLKPGSLVQKISRINSRRISNKCSPFSKTFVYRKNPKLAIGRKISSFQQELGKIDLRSGNFIHSKGVRDTILENSSAKDYCKTGGNVQNTEIIKRSRDYWNAGQRSHKKVEHQFPDQFLSNILLVKKKDGGNHPCKN